MRFTEAGAAGYEILARRRGKDEVCIGSKPESIQAIPSICGYDFEYNLFARSSSAALLGAALNLSCPDAFVVTHSREEVAKGAPKEQLVVRLSPEVHRELSSMVDQSCKAAEIDGTARRYIGQQVGKKNYVAYGLTTPEEQARILQLLGIRPASEPEPPSPLPPKSVLRQLMDTSEGQTIGGIASGIPLAVVPGGTIAADLAIEAHLLPPGTRAARIGKACAELGVGAIQVAVGCGGMGIGGGTSSTGVGAPVGALVFVGSLGLTATGMANCANGTRHLAIELWGTEDSPGTRSTGALAQTGSSAATPTAIEATTQGKATTPKAPETSLTVSKEAPVAKTTLGKGKQSASAKPTPVAKGAKRGPKTDPDAPHNAAIRREAAKLKAQGNRILYGGGEGKEEVVKIDGGLKMKRRPDITYRTPTGEIRGLNVGRTNADGTPVKREAEALKDLNDHSDRPTDFVAY